MSGGQPGRSSILRAMREGVNENPAGHPQGAWQFSTGNKDKRGNMLTWKCMGDYRNCRCSVQEGESFSSAREGLDAPVIYTRKMKEKE